MCIVYDVYVWCMYGLCVYSAWCRLCVWECMYGIVCVVYGVCVCVYQCISSGLITGDEWKVIHRNVGNIDGCIIEETVPPST